MPVTWTALLLALASVCAVPVVTAHDAPKYVSHIVVVQFAPEVFFPTKSNRTGLQDFDCMAGAHGVYTIDRMYPLLDHVQPTPKTRRNLMALRRTYYVRYHANTAPRQVADDLRAVRGVVYAEPVPVYRTQALRDRLDPDDPSNGEQTGLWPLRLPEPRDAVKIESGAPRVVIATATGDCEWRYEDEADWIGLRIDDIDSVHESLSALYTATGGDNWYRNDNWDITTVPTKEELDTWYGVTLNEQGWLVELSLRSNNLSGTLPAELGDRSQLVRLVLSNNSLTGEIPAELGSLSQLQDLWLNRNSFTGEIPAELGNLSQLRYLTLWDNNLTGEIPAELGNLSQLQWLYLFRNSFTGGIPETLGNLSQLQGLFLPFNNLTSEIPETLGNLSQLRELELWGNSLTGEIPETLGNLSQLQELWLEDNSLTGEIPETLGNLSQLVNLVLKGNDLAGGVPETLGSLSQLQELWLEDNSLTGRLPRSLMHLNNLQRLSFGRQYLCAPEDAAFQAWLSSILNVSGPTCRSLVLGDSIEDQTFTMGIAIPPLVLPKAVGGAAPYAYMLDPAPPTGLVFDAAARTITGIPTMTADQATYTYTVTDANVMSDSVNFGLEVVASVSFATGVADQSFPRAHPVVPLVLPEATGGVPPVSYTLTPTLLAGLTVDHTTRTLSGLPTVVTSIPVPYTYKATGANGSADSLTFRIEVYSPVSTEQESLPETFAVRGNYPNPFQHATRIVIDLPWPTRVTVEVMDVTGRRVLTVPETDLSAGWEQSVELAGVGLPSGLYLYRVHASSPVGSVVRRGRFMHLR